MREKIRVLYAEGNQEDRTLTRAHFALEAPEFEIDIVGSKEELLEQLRGQTYDLLVLDRDMADLEGLTVLGQVQPAGSLSPVVFVASKEGEDLILQVLSVGQSDYISRNDEHFTSSLGLLRRLVSQHRKGNPGSRSIYPLPERQVLYLTLNNPESASLLTILRGTAPHLKLKVVTSGRDALKLLGSETLFDLLLTDLRLEDMTALDLVSQPGVLGSRRPLVILSDARDEAIAVSLLRLGADDYIVKREDYLTQLPYSLENTIHRFRLEQSQASSQKDQERMRQHYERQLNDEKLRLTHESAQRLQAQQELETLREKLAQTVERSRFQHLLGVNTALEAELQEQRKIDELTARLAKVVEATGDLVGLLDERARWLYINPSGRRLLGLAEEEVSNLPLSACYPEWARELVADQGLSTAVREGRWKGEAAILARDGQEVPVSQVILSQKGTDGKVEFLATVLRDTSSQKALEEELRSNQARLSLMLKQLPLFLWATDKDLNYTFRSGVCWTSGDPKLDRLGGKNLQESFQTSDPKSPPIASHLQALHGHSASYEVEADERLYSCWVEPFRDDEGHIIGTIGVGRDVTEQRKALEALQQSEGNYQQLIDQASDGIFLVDKDGKTQEVNAALCQMLDYPREELLSSNIKDLIHPEDPKELPLQLDRLESGQTVQLERRLLCKGGALLPVEISCRMLGQDRALAIVRDVRERKVREEQKSQTQKMEAIGKLAEGIAHDFKNMLTAIQGYSDLLLRKLDPMSPLCQDVEEIRKAGDRAATLTDQLLACGGNQILQNQILDLNSVVGRMEENLRSLVGDQIEVTVVAPEELDRIEADLGQVEKILINLVSNSRDAMPQGGRLTIKTANVELDEGQARRHGSLGPGRYVMLALSDTGIGMDDQTQSRIFEPFFSTKPTTSSKGLGLTIVYGIVKQSGGHISVSSQEGLGTTTAIYFPRFEKRVEATSEVGASSLPTGETKTILVVDDEEVVRNLLRTTLRQNGYSVLEARHGIEALEVSEKHKGRIDLLVSDVVMPGLGGPELARRLVALRPGIKVLLMSGYSDEVPAQNGELEVGTDIVQKPLSLGAFLLRVRQILEVQSMRRGF